MTELKSIMVSISKDHC